VRSALKRDRTSFSPPAAVTPSVIDGTPWS
jgi:hypothetical protein